MKKLKIAFITNGIYTDKYFYQLAKWVKDNDDKFICKDFIIIKNKKKQLLNSKIIKKISFKFLILFERILLFFYTKHKEHFKKFNLKTIINDSFEIFEIQKKTQSFFSDKDLDKIKKQNYDIIIRACSNILTGDILKIPKLGIFSFHHGDIEKYRGTPAGFWEVFYKNDTTGFIIQKLNEKLDNGKILFKGSFQTKFFFLLNQAEMYSKSIVYFQKVLNDVHQNKNFNSIDCQNVGKVYELPKIKNQFIYILNLFLRILKKFFNRKVFWKIFYYNLKKNSFLIYPNSKNKFLADPFIFKNNSENYIFAEEYCFRNRKGYIVCIDINKSGNKKTVLKEKFHLSFPYLFEYKNKIFMCPETSSINEIRLYVSKKFPYEWSYHTTLIKNIKCVDSIIFERDNIWWLLTNIARDDYNDFGHDLSIFYSVDGPLSSKWIKHHKNPIFVDAKISRNAGFFKNDRGEIYRVSQKQGFDQYGRGIDFHKILEISKEKYIEKTENIDLPKDIIKTFEKNSVHHFSKNSENIVFDFN